MSQNLIAEGIWPCVVLSAASGTNDKGIAVARINVRFTEGENAGRNGTYEDVVDARSSLYVARSLKAVGWQGKSLASLADDCAKWIAATGGSSTAEVKHIPIKNGKRAGQIWDKINSIGRGPRVLAPLAGDAMADADAALRKALADDGGATPPDSAPIDDDQIPFVTSARGVIGGWL